MIIKINKQQSVNNAEQTENNFKGGNEQRENTAPLFCEYLFSAI
jgi:hypothetical protein